MSVPDNELWWWKEENRPDGVHCDRNGCDNLATRQVAWRHMARYHKHESKQEWRQFACVGHADWWIQSSGGFQTSWRPDLAVT